MPKLRQQNGLQPVHFLTNSLRFIPDIYCLLGIFAQSIHSILQTFVPMIYCFYCICISRPPSIRQAFYNCAVWALAGQEYTPAVWVDTEKMCIGN